MAVGLRQHVSGVQGGGAGLRRPLRGVASGTQQFGCRNVFIAGQCGAGVVLQVQAAGGAYAPVRAVGHGYGVWL